MPATSTAPRKSATVDTARSRLAPSPGQTVKLRAIALGQYGHAKHLAMLLDVGTVVDFRVQDLEPLATYQARRDESAKKAGIAPSYDYIDGTDLRTITVGGVEYALPSWLEDAAAPSSIVEDDIVGDIAGKPSAITGTAAAGVGSTDADVL